jgi:tetratricopeptide (TPR) repeat protein
MDNLPNPNWCYQVLAISPTATTQEIKIAYRQLARKYHPDLNPGDREAEDRFKLIVQAYRTLLSVRSQVTDSTPTKATPKTDTTPTGNSTSSSTSGVRFHVKQRLRTPPASLSPEEKLLKLSTLNRVYSLLKRQDFQQAVDVVEKLAIRFPNDPDVQPWLATAYHRLARQFISHQQSDRARIYLKKALQADPHNKKLWQEIERDYKTIERQLMF